MSLIKSVKKRMKALRSERSYIEDTWIDCSDMHLSHRGRFLNKDITANAVRNGVKINNTSRMAVRAFQAGMVAGMTNPARPWFRLATPDVGLMGYQPVREWLHQTEKILLHIFKKSNLYRSLSPLYGETGTFGTGLMGMFRDFENVIHTQQYTIGSYFLACNEKGVVDTVYRRYSRTVGQVVEQFGKESVCRTTREMYSKGHTESKVILIHAVEPNNDRDGLSPLAKHKRFRSIYIEEGAQEDERPLRESGFDTFPYLAPRFDAVDGDVYASSCPGFDALGDAKALQKEEAKLLKAIDLQVDPPLQVPSELSKSMSGGVVPGQIEYVANTKDGIRSMYEVRPDINALRENIRETQARIDHAFYKDLFLMIANRPAHTQTAREVAERHEEKLLMLSPLVENFNTELYDPLIDIAFNHAVSAGVLPPPPPELEGMDLKVEYVSTLNQAMKMAGITAIENTVGFVLSSAQADPNLLKKLDLSKATEDVADAYGASPSILRSDDEVAKMVQAEQAQMQQQQAMEALSQAPDAVKKMADAETPEGNVLDRVTGNG